MTSKQIIVCQFLVFATWIARGETECNNSIVITLTSEENLGRLDLVNAHIEPFTYGLQLQNPMAMASDSESGFFFFSDNTLKKIYKMNFKESAIASVIKDLDDDSIVEGMSLDPVQQTLFMTDSGKSIITRMNIDATNSAVILTSVNGLSVPRAIVTDSQERRLYYTDCGYQAHISRANYNGTGIERINRSVFQPTGLTADFTFGKLYFCDDTTVQSMNLDGTSVRFIQSAFGLSLFDVTLIFPQLYLSARSQASVSGNYVLSFNVFSQIPYFNHEAIFTSGRINRIQAICFPSAAPTTQSRTTTNPTPPTTPTTTTATTTTRTPTGTTTETSETSGTILRVTTELNTQRPVVPTMHVSTITTPTTTTATTTRTPTGTTTETSETSGTILRVTTELNTQLPVVPTMHVSTITNDVTRLQPGTVESTAESVYTEIIIDGEENKSETSKQWNPHTSTVTYSSSPDAINQTTVIIVSSIIGFVIVTAIVAFTLCILKKRTGPYIVHNEKCVRYVRSKSEIDTDDDYLSIFTSGNARYKSFSEMLEGKRPSQAYSNPVAFLESSYLSFTEYNERYSKFPSRDNRKQSEGYLCPADMRRQSEDIYDTLSVKSVELPQIEEQETS